jgi:hypothetical protein
MGDQIKRALDRSGKKSGGRRRATRDASGSMRRPRWVLREGDFEAVGFGILTANQWARYLGI